MSKEAEAREGRKNTVDTEDTGFEQQISSYYQPYICSVLSILLVLSLD